MRWTWKIILSNIARLFSQTQRVWQRRFLMQTAPGSPRPCPVIRLCEMGCLAHGTRPPARDGMYEMRLVVNIAERAPTIYRVSPVRILNNPTDRFVSLPTRIPLQPTPTQIGGTGSVIRPTLRPTPTPLNTGEPTVTALTDSNVRRATMCRIHEWVPC